MKAKSKYVLRSTHERTVRRLRRLRRLLKETMASAELAALEAQEWKTALDQALTVNRTLEERWRNDNRFMTEGWRRALDRCSDIKQGLARRIEELQAKLAGRGK